MIAFPTAAVTAGAALFAAPHLAAAWKFNSSDWTTVAISMTPASQAPGPDGTERFDPDSGGHPTVSIIGAASAVVMVLALFLLVLLAWLDGRRRRRALEQQRRGGGLEGGMAGGQQGMEQQRVLAMQPTFMPVVVLSPNNEVDLARRLSSDGAFAKENGLTLQEDSRKAAVAPEYMGQLTASSRVLLCRDDGLSFYPDAGGGGCTAGRQLPHQHAVHVGEDAEGPAAHTVAMPAEMVKLEHSDSTVEAAGQTSPGCLR